MRLVILVASFPLIGNALPHPRSEPTDDGIFLDTTKQHKKLKQVARFQSREGTTVPLVIFAVFDENEEFRESPSRRHTSGTCNAA